MYGTINGSLMHISTDDTFFIDSIKSEELSKCPICGRMATTEMGYIGIRWNCCNVVLEEEWRGSIARKKREYILKLSRKELGKLLGYSTKTIKQYEWVSCSKKYYDKLDELIENQYRNLQRE